MKQVLRAAGCAVAGLVFATAAAAQDPSLPESVDVVASQSQFVINLGLGASVTPRYDGASDYLVQPVPLVSFSRLTLPGFGALGGSDATRGVFLFPTFDYIGTRKPGDDSDLRGTEKIDWALALGLGVGYRYDWWRVFVQADYGFNGYSGFRAQIGADVIAAPAPRASISIGPRLAWAGDHYMDTYFSVSDAEAAGSGGRLDAYSADGGLRAVGVAMNSSYALTDSVFLLGNARYDRLIGDAGDSPIVEAGDANQFSVGLGVSYRFSFDPFN